MAGHSIVDVIPAFAGIVDEAGHAPAAGGHVGHGFRVVKLEDGNISWVGVASSINRVSFLV